MDATAALLFLLLFSTDSCSRLAAELLRESCSRAALIEFVRFSCLRPDLSNTHDTVSHNEACHLICAVLACVANESRDLEVSMLQLYAYSDHAGLI